MSKKNIIIIKKVSSHGGHHGGAWKVAYADFVTAMMALFIVLWLLSSSDQVRKAVAGYFNDPLGCFNLNGSQNGGADSNAPPAHDNVQQLKEHLEQAIAKAKDFKALSKQIEMTVTPEGLRIELLESKNRTFFESGSANLSGDGTEILGMLAKQLGAVPNRISIEGHTDSQPYANSAYGNWELSADRANAARRLMQSAGLRADQISQVRGYADQQLRIPQNPLDPSNRRISLIVQYIAGQPMQPPISPNLGSAEGAGPVAAPAKSDAEPGVKSNPESSAKTAPSAPSAKTPQPTARAQQSLAGRLLSKLHPR
jgi:chemotaxis protein MotB